MELRLFAGVGLVALIATIFAVTGAEEKLEEACTLKVSESFEAYENCLRHSRRRRNVGYYGYRNDERAYGYRGDERSNRRDARAQSREGHPCRSYVRLNEPRRSVSYTIPFLTGDALCDRALKQRWYRFEGDAGGKMPEICPNEFSCGTHAPIWLNGPHPTRTGEVLDQEVCVSLGGRCCTRRWNIKVANCGGFFTYRLTDTPGCFMAYCAGEMLPCPEGTSSATGFGPTCTADIPRLNSVARLSHETDMNKIIFHCDYDGNIPPGASLNVQWFVQGDASEDNRGDKFPVYEEQLGVRTRSALTEDKWMGRMGSTIYCRFIVSSRNRNGHTSSQTVESEKFFAGIKILNRVIRVSESEAAGTLQLQPTVPVRCLPQFGDACSIDISLAFDQEYEGRTCKDGKAQQVVFGDCNIMVKPDNWNQIHNVSVKAVRDFYRDGNRAMRLNFKPVFSTTTSQIWHNYQLPEVEVIAEDVYTKMCSTTGDPHYSTFDGVYYHMYLEGEFVLYKSTKFPIQINTRVQKCGRSQGVEVTCNCGIAVMVEDDAIVIDRCQKVNRKLAMGDKFPDGFETLHRHALQQGESFVEGLKVIEHDEGRKYTIMMPTGAFVEFQIGENWINIFVHSSSDDFKSTVGLCGIIDNDRDNDLTHRDGRTVYRVQDGSGCGENQDVCDFSNSWRVRPEDSFFGPIITTELPQHDFFGKERYCKCIRMGDGRSQVECNYNYDVANCMGQVEVENGVDKTDDIKIHSDKLAKKIQEGNSVEKKDLRRYDRFQNLIIDEHGHPVPGAAERTRLAIEVERRQFEKREQERRSGPSGTVQQKTREDKVAEHNRRLAEREALIQKREQEWKEKQAERERLINRGADVRTVDEAGQARGRDREERPRGRDREQQPRGQTREEQMKERDRIVRERQQEREMEMERRRKDREERRLEEKRRHHDEVVQSGVRTREEAMRAHEEARRKQILQQRTGGQAVENDNHGNLPADAVDKMAQAREEFARGIGQEAMDWGMDMDNEQHHRVDRKMSNSDLNPAHLIPESKHHSNNQHIVEDEVKNPTRESGVKLNNDLLTQRFLSKRRRAKDAFLATHYGHEDDKTETNNKIDPLKPWFEEDIKDYQLDYFEMDFISDDNFIGHEPDWPTPGGITEQIAKQYCVNFILRSKVGKMCNKVVSDRLHSVMESCLTDVKVTDDLQWAMSSLTSLISECTEEIHADAALWKAPQTHSDYMVGDDPTAGTRAHKMLKSICPNDCYKQGRCNAGKCHCRTGYTGLDCSVKKWMPPQITYIQDGGLCDIQRRMCKSVTVYGKGFRKDAHIVCRFHETNGDSSAYITTDATFETYDCIICELPQHHVTGGNPDAGSSRRSTHEYSLTVLQDNVATEDQTVVLFDSLCQNCEALNGEFFCFKKSDSCEVNGVCFAPGDRHPEDCCKVCDPKTATDRLVPFQANTIYRIRPDESTYVLVQGESLSLDISAMGPYGCDADYDVSKTDGLVVQKTQKGIHVELRTDVVGIYELGVLARDPCGGVTTKKFAIYVNPPEGWNAPTGCAFGDQPPTFSTSNNLNMIAVSNELLKIQFAAADPEGGQVGFFIMKAMVASTYVSITTTGMMRYVAPRFPGTDILIIIAEDDCGNTSEMPITITTRACPCPEGICLPDPRSPRGSGDYHCECRTLQGIILDCQQPYAKVIP